MPPKTSEPENPDVLLLMSSDSEYLLLDRLLNDQHVSYTLCRSTDDLMERANMGAGPAVIDEKSLTEKSWDLFSKYLASDQPDWSSLPVIVFAGREISGRGVAHIEAFHSLTVLTRPVSIPTFISLLLTHRSARRRQLFLKELLERQALNVEMLNRLALQLTDAEAREHRRISSLIHDGLQQLIVAATINLDPLLRREDTAATAAEVESLLGEALEASRSLCYEISPPVLETFGLKTAAEWMARDFRKKFGLTIHLNCDETANRIQPPLRELLFRALRELLFNVVKHGETHEAYLDMLAERGEGRFRVRDKGRGFDPGLLHSAERAAGGFGLFSLRQRIDALGGELKIDSRPGAGCSVAFRFPLPE